MTINKASTARKIAVVFSSLPLVDLGLGVDVAVAVDMDVGRPWSGSETCFSDITSDTKVW